VSYVTCAIHNAVEITHVAPSRLRKYTTNRATSCSGNCRRETCRLERKHCCRVREIRAGRHVNNTSVVAIHYARTRRTITRRSAILACSIHSLRTFRKPLPADKNTHIAVENRYKTYFSSLFAESTNRQMLTNLRATLSRWVACPSTYVRTHHV